MPNTQPDGKTHEKSGVVIRVRDAGFDEFDAQIQDAIELLEDDRELFRNIVSFQGVEEAVLSFGINWQNTYTHTDHLPAALIRLAGEIGLDLEIVHMPVRPSPPTQSEATVE